MGKAVMGIVETRQEAESILGDLQKAGIPSSDISILFPDKHGHEGLRTRAQHEGARGRGCRHRHRRRHRRNARSARGHRRPRDPGLRPADRGGSDHGRAQRGGGWCSGRRHRRRADRHGHPGDRGQALRRQDPGGNILVAVHTETSEARQTAVDVSKRGGAHDVTLLSEASVPKEKSRDDRAAIERKERERLEAESAEREQQERERIQRESGIGPLGR